MSKKLTEQEAKEAIIKPTVGGYTRADIAGAAMAEFNAAFFAAMNGEPYEQVEIEPEFARSLLAVVPTIDVQSITRASHVWFPDCGWVEVELDQGAADRWREYMWRKAHRQQVADQRLNLARYLEGVLSRKSGCCQQEAAGDRVVVPWDYDDNGDRRCCVCWSVYKKE